MKTNTPESKVFFKDGRIIEQPQYGKIFEAVTRKGIKQKLRPFVGTLVYGTVDQICIGCVNDSDLVIEHWECHDPYGTEYPLFLKAMEVMVNLLEINNTSCYNCYMVANGQKQLTGNLFEVKAA